MWPKTATTKTNREILHVLSEKEGAQNPHFFFSIIEVET
jgi:hypothetical protein